MDWLFYEGQAKELIEEAASYDVKEEDIKKRDIKRFAKEHGIDYGKLIKGLNQVSWVTFKK